MNCCHSNAPNISKKPAVSVKQYWIVTFCPTMDFKACKGLDVGDKLLKIVIGWFLLMFMSSTTQAGICL